MRFYCKREIEQAPQSEWLYEIYKNSMNARIKAVGIVGFIYVLLSTYYYETVIRTVQDSKVLIREMRTIKDDLAVLANEADIIS